ncbi:integral membrane protein [Thioalkalivibrio sulfidiphilus HL-EbGr7]|uniref:Integral membrane protein n=1 Tax=Thioalkalivibrio sulfidiphilus (strain HL-EbGR7) TaxID=396588 RepID=B8GPW7_THISH|nr:DUF2189 domain-containing protein [Thioalkalivibrio sulfidiphilus]ACL74114.1 integral membrane protein [Thioalkalivibrio sulfidiphilus HL-EbGr7]
MDKVINTSPSIHIPTLHRVAPDRPYHWLAAGLKDIKRTPGLSLGYGLFFSLVGVMLLTGAWNDPWLVMTFMAGFLLVGPLTALGLYEISRRQERGEPLTLMDTLTSWRRNPLGISLYTVFLGIIMIAWIRFTSLMIALFFEGVPDKLQEGWMALITTEQGFGFLLVFTLSGAAAALLVFITGVVTLPMMKERRQDVITCVMTSIRAVQHNPAPMILWALMLVVLIGIGFATFLVGMIFILPLLGHASWHAYRELVDREVIA